jgi:CarD family transcriptional regulator
MFEIGEKIVYGSEGVFIVSEYASSPIDKNDVRRFYILKPAHGPEGNVIFTPVDNERVRMRAIMTREEAMAFLDTISEIGIVTVEKEKNRRERYREIMANAGCREYVSIIKTVRRRRKEFLRLKKRLSEADTEYEKKARFCLHGELASALNIPFLEVEHLICRRLDGEI